MKRIKTRYRVSAVIIVMLVATIALQGEIKPVGESEQTVSITSPQQQDKSTKKAALSYVKQVFGACKPQALAYLQQTNPTFNTQLIKHNYIDNTFVYDSSYVGLFSINDGLPSIAGYSINDLLDYKKNIDLAYQLYTQNNYSFTGDTCL